MSNYLNKIPYSTEHEISGYIENGNIHCEDGKEYSANSFSDKEIVFHTHIDSEYDELPSIMDLINFIHSENQKSIIVTKSQFIILNRTKETDESIKKMDELLEDDLSAELELNDYINQQDDLGFLNVVLSLYDTNLFLKNREGWLSNYKEIIGNVFKINLESGCKLFN